MAESKLTVMISASNTMLNLLSSLTRTVIVEVIVQYPNPSNNLQLGGQLQLDGILDLTIQRNEEPSSDTFDLTIANTDGRYSPLRGTRLINTSVAQNPVSSYIPHRIVL